MKKIFTLTVLAILSFYVMASEPSIWDGTASAFDVSGGKGDTEVDPILIESAAQLAYLAQQVHGGTLYDGKFFKLTTDIDLDNREWLPIGYHSTSTKNKHFKASFDGNGKKIFNLKISQNVTIPGDGADISTYALFGGIEGPSGNKCYIKNFGIESGNITATTNGNYVASIVGWTKNSVISECYNKADLNGVYRVGGIIAQSDSPTDVKNCYNKGNLTVTAAGSPSGTNYGIGGIIGKTTTAVINNSYNVGNIIIGGASLPANYWGGIVGDPTTTPVNSYYLETVVTGGNTKGTSYTQAQLLASGFVQTINNSQEPAKWIADSESINSGLPILFWENEGITTGLINIASKQLNLSNYPSLVTDFTTVTFNNEKSGYVTLKVYDIAGKEVIDVYKGIMQAGAQSLDIDAKGISGGVYIYRLTTPIGKGTNKMIVK